MNRIFLMLLVLGIAGGLLHAKRTFFPSQLQVAQEAASQPISVPPAQTVRGPAVDVFGRDGCGYTRRMLADLQAADVPVRYYDIDSPAVESQFHDRFKHAGIMRDGGYELPVVEVADYAYARPASESVIDRFRMR